MSSFFSCAAYSDVETTIWLDEHVVFFALEDKEKKTSIHLTLNPFRVRTLAKYLSVAVAQIQFKNLQAEENFDDEEYAWEVPKFICLKAQRIRIADSLRSCPN